MPAPPTELALHVAPPQEQRSAPLKHTPPSTSRPSRASVPVWQYATFALLAAYLLSPALTSVHVEGFTAQVEIGAIAANAGRLDRANLLYPLHAQYFYLSRQGVVYLLQALMRLMGTTGDVTFRVLVIGASATLIAATVATARRFGRVSARAAFAAVLLTPGLVELAFHFNDNVVSAAVGLLGLATLPRGTAAASSPLAAGRATRAVWAIRAFGAGVLLGFAILARPDAVFLLPVAAGLAWLEARRWPELLPLGCLTAAGIASALGVSAYASGSTIVDALRISRHFDLIHAALRHPADAAWTLVFFAGLPNLVLIPLGTAAGFRTVARAGDADPPNDPRSDARKWAAVMVVLPAVLLVYSVPHAMEPRQFYPLLAPFVAIHGARGLSRVAAALESPDRRRRTAGFVVALGVALICVAPPVLVRVKDGPRAVVGRLWSPLLWFQWQHAIAQTLGQASALVDIAEQAPRTVVVTTHFNADHYLRLRLWQRGFQSFRAGEAVPGCVGGFEVWRKAGRELVQIRTENPHFMFPDHDYLQALEVQRAFQCSAAFAGAPVYTSGQGRDPSRDDLLAPLYATRRADFVPLRVTFGWPPSIADLLHGRATDDLNRTTLLTPREVALLSQSADRVVAAHLAHSGGTLPGYDAVMAMFGYLSWHPPLPRPPR